MDVTREMVIAGTGLFADLDPSEQAQIAALMRPFEVGSGRCSFERARSPIGST